MNAAIEILESSLHARQDIHRLSQRDSPLSHQMTRNIREIEDAITVLRNSMEAPKESSVPLPMRVEELHLTLRSKASNLTFSEALDAVNRGKTVQRSAAKGIIGKLHPFMVEDCAVTVADMIATDWSIVEDGK